MKSKLTIAILTSAAVFTMTQGAFAQGMAPNPKLTKEQQEALKNGRTPDTQKQTGEGSNNGNSAAGNPGGQGSTGAGAAGGSSGGGQGSGPGAEAGGAAGAGAGGAAK